MPSPWSSSIEIDNPLSALITFEVGHNEETRCSLPFSSSIKNPNEFGFPEGIVVSISMFPDVGFNTLPITFPLNITFPCGIFNAILLSE